MYLSDFETWGSKSDQGEKQIYILRPSSFQPTVSLFILISCTYGSGAVFGPIFQNILYIQNPEAHFFVILSQYLSKWVISSKPFMKLAIGQCRKSKM